MREHRGFHRRAAHLGQRGAAGGFRQAADKRGLTRRRLFLAGEQTGTENDFIDDIRRHTGALDRFANGDGAEFGCRQAGEFALKIANGGARGTDDDDWICVVHALVLIDR
jgi:hypothetical protein